MNMNTAGGWGMGLSENEAQGGSAVALGLGPRSESRGCLGGRNVVMVMRVGRNILGVLVFLPVCVGSYSFTAFHDFLPSVDQLL